MRTRLILPVFLLAIGQAAPAKAASGGAYGYVYAYNETTYSSSLRGELIGGRPVNMFYCSSSWWGICTAFGIASTTTNFQGYYQVWANSSASNTMAFLLTAGSETAVPSVSMNGSWNYADITRAPHMVSPNGSVWMRKFGNGAYPVVVVEGYDAQDAIKSGNEVPSPAPQQPGLLGLLDAMPVNTSTTAYGSSPNTLLSWLVANNYTVYLLTTGASWGASAQGTGDHSDGVAYQTMKLAWQARQRYTPNRKLAVGGFSLGGAVTQAGLVHWCNGDFYWQIGPEYDLRNGCDEVGMWFAIDSALAGATAPESLLRFIKDTKNTVSKATQFKDAINTTAAREVLTRWVTDGCTTGCFNSDGEGQNCSSKNTSFMTGGCAVDDSVNVAFQSWSGTGPTRGTTGTLVPAVAYSLGRQPNSGGGGIPGDCSTYGDEYFKISVKNVADIAWGLFTCDSCVSDVNMHFYGQARDCQHGSRLSPLLTLNNTPVTDGLEGLGWFIATGGLLYGSADGRAIVNFAPTYISTSSSLLWPSYNVIPWTGWKDWATNDANDAMHDPRAAPAGETGMAVGWISEYTKGRNDKPVRTATKTANVTRAASTETLNGQDDDGDELADELLPYEGDGLTAAFHDRSNQNLTVISKNRYWNIRLSDGAFTRKGYLDNGWIDYPNYQDNGQLRWDPLTTPKSNGYLPWQADGVTGAWDSYDGNYLVVISANRMWVWSWTGQYWYTWGTFGSYSPGLTGIIPNFGTAPAVNGEYPWTGKGITGVWRRPGDRYLWLYRDYLYWAWDFATNTWYTAGSTSLYETGAEWLGSDGVRYMVSPSGYYNYYNAYDQYLGYGYLQWSSYWQNAPQAVAGIVIDSATYGGNCGVAAGNQTRNMWANCDGKQTCRYMLDYTRIGDPAPGCGKDYTVSYHCENGGAKSFYLPGEAGAGGLVQLSCP